MMDQMHFSVWITNAGSDICAFKPYKQSIMIHQVMSSKLNYDSCHHLQVLLST
jgi:hypothetical protein